MSEVKNEPTHRVYVVEDDPVLGSILLEELKISGFDSKLIVSGLDAVNTIKEEIPDVVLLDIFLPGLNGLEVLEKLREDEKTKNLKVVVVSNIDHSENRQRAKELGADFILKAATTPSDIVVLVKDVVS